jgi:hypothetical protein
MMRGQQLTAWVMPPPAAIDRHCGKQEQM